MAFAAVYSYGLYLSGDPHGIESFPPLILAGLRHITWACSLPDPSLEDRISLPQLTGRQPLSPALCALHRNGGVSWAEQTVPPPVSQRSCATVSLWLVDVDCSVPVA